MSNEHRMGVQPPLNVPQEMLAAEVERLRGEQKLDGAEIERLQKVVADQALTIGTLKDELGATTEALSHERDCSTGLADELVRSEKEAQTARLALDVALREVEALRSQISSTLEALTYTFGPTEISEKQRVAKVLELRDTVKTWTRENPPPGAASIEAERNMANDEGVQRRKALSESQWRGDRDPEPGAAT